MPDNKQEIFDAIKSIMSSHSKRLVSRGETEKAYNLYGTKTVTVAGREYEGLYLASVIIKKNFVGFYFFPIYGNPKMAEKIPLNLRKCLKGKTCFHITKYDKELFKSIDSTMKMGKEAYIKLGWI
ncbi:MAG: hypothetical protein ACHQJ4_05125 [Ignavibacteria bacterium]